MGGEHLVTNSFGMNVFCFYFDPHLTTIIWLIEFIWNEIFSPFYLIFLFFFFLFIQFIKYIGEKRLSNDVQNDWNQQTLDMTITTQQKSATNSEGHHSGSISTTIYHHHHHQRRLLWYITTIFDTTIGIVIIIISIISMLNEFLFLQY